MNPVIKRLGFWLPLFGISVVMDRRLFVWISQMQNEHVTLFFAYLASFIFFVALVTIAVETIVWHNQKEFILPFLLSFCVAMWIGFIMKGLFTIDRPYVEFAIINYIPEQGYGFPSSHAIAAFSLVPLMWYKNRHMAVAWSLFSCLIAFSRLYLQVHFLSDVVVGAFIGYEVSSYFISLEQRFGLFSRFNRLLHSTLEIRRQLFHTAFGITLVFLYKTYLLTVDSLFILLLVSGLLVLTLKKYRSPRWLFQALSFFERDKHLERFPARGVFYFLLGAWLAITLFNDQIALAAILILAFGDSVANIIGRYFGKWTILYNPKKKWEGVFAGIFFSMIGASFFVPLWVAFVASAVAMLFESFDLKIGKWEVDDNLLIPVVGGVVMMLML